MKAVITCLWITLWANGQSITPTPITVDPLDMSAVVLPAEPQPTTVYLSWNNLPIQIAAHTDVCGSFDLKHWQVLATLTYATNETVQIINSNPVGFYRVGNIL